MLSLSDEVALGFKPMQMGPDKTLNLSQATIVVLFEIAQRAKTPRTEFALLDDAELAALWDLASSVEKVVDEVCSPDWAALLAQSKQQLKSSYGLD